MPKPNRIAEVVLLQRLPRNAQVFDYEIPAGQVHNVGDLVTVPFRRQACEGVIVKLKTKSDIKAALKPITARLAASFVSAHQLHLTQQVARHYGVAWATALKPAVPFIPNKRFVPPALSPALKKTKRTPAKPITIAFHSADQRLAAGRSLIGQVTARKQQVFILVPELSHLMAWQSQFEASHEVATFSTDQSLTIQRSNWLKVRSGTARVIIGTRAALFLPFQNLGGVLVDYAENENYKQSDQNPRYDGLEVARWLATLSNASLAYLSPAPPVSLWWKGKQGTVRFETLTAQSAKHLEVIDLTHEQQGGSQGSISYSLTERINQVLGRGGKIFLYLNRRGTATGVTCRDCGFTPSCTVCKRTLVWSAKNNQLRCYHCGSVQPVPLPCPTCGGSNLRYVGAGLERLEQELAELWPTVTTVTLEGEVTGAQVNRVAGANIILGSRAAWRYLTFTQFGLVAALLPDTELSLPEYRAAEDVWATMRFFLTSGAKAVVAQTFRPEHYLWTSLQARALNTFYQAELKERVQYGYPPYQELIRFTAQSPEETAALTQAKEVAKIIKQHTSTANLTGPYPDYYRQVRGQYRFHLLLRYGLSFKPETLWPLLPDAILIDRHPLRILS